MPNGERDKILLKLVEGQASHTQKLDDLIVTLNTRHEEQRALFQKQYEWTSSIQKRVEVQESITSSLPAAIATVNTHEQLRQRVIGAARLVAWVSGYSTVLGAIIAAVFKLFHTRGGTP